MALQLTADRGCKLKRKRQRRNERPLSETLVRTTYAAWVGMVAGARVRPLAARGVEDLVTLHATAVVESSAWHPTLSAQNVAPRATN
eukprot:7387981-Prymnesium_polylepis.1